MLGIKTSVKRIIDLPQYFIQRGIYCRPFASFILSKRYSLNHLRHFNERSIGPIQRDEAMLLYALVKTVDPKTIVEFGFYKGHSATNFLKAMSSDARLFSYDISDSAMQLARKINDRRFRFIFKSQDEFNPSDINNRPIDLVFFDASHDFKLNVATFEEVRKYLSERAFLVVHDTGTWHGDLKGLQTPEGYFLDASIGIGYVHQPGERNLVNYIREHDKDFDQIHMHSTSKFRHGLTVLQRNVYALPV